MPLRRAKQVPAELAPGNSGAMGAWQNIVGCDSW